MDYRKLTKILTIVSIALALIYDAIILIKGGTESSISHYVIELANTYSLFTIFFGVLCGHFFLRAKEKHLLIEWGYKFPIFPLSCGLFAGYFTIDSPVWLTFLVGMLLGHLFWRVRQTDIFKEMGI